jgi:CO/xanthine dehydrogenase FAD-binding subunit
VKPAPFDYYDPATLEEALALLARYGDDAKLLAGGQSLVPVLNMRLAKPRVLIDLNRVDGLAYIREEGALLALGALTRHAAIERSDLVARRQPLLTEAVGQIGHSQIRNRGTIGGSLAHADPSAELPAVMAALEATLVLTGPAGARAVPAEEFFLMYFTTALRPDEILTEVRVPVLPDGAGYAFAEVARRHGDFALCGVACVLELDPPGPAPGGRLIKNCRLALTGVGMTPVRATEAEALLVGRPPTETAFAAAADAVRASLTPDEDIHASSDYRRQLAGVLTERALKRALTRTGGGAAP